MKYSTFVPSEVKLSRKPNLFSIIGSLLESPSPLDHCAIAIYTRIFFLTVTGSSKARFCQVGDQVGQVKDQVGRLQELNKILFGANNIKR